MTIRTALVTIGIVVTVASAGTFQLASWPIGSAPASLHDAIARADLLIVEMQGAVLRELTDALQRGGAESAIGFCHLDAKAIADRVGVKERVAMGRTSDRLRNPANAAPAWAAPLVQAHAGKRASSIPGFAVDLGDNVGVLRPMIEQPLCASCHGPDGHIAPAVRLVLQRRYPLDRATGFKDGDLRGWFWVEVPKR
jgi:hypothetical protein